MSTVRSVFHVFHDRPARIVWLTQDGQVVREDVVTAASMALGDVLAAAVEQMVHHYECPSTNVWPYDDTVCVCFRQAPAKAARAWRAAREFGGEAS